MPLAFFTSSTGDTNLVIATIKQLYEDGYKEKIHLVALTTVALSKFGSLNLPNLEKTHIGLITGVAIHISNPCIDTALYSISNFITDNKISRALITVPSPPTEVLPYLIAKNLTIPTTVIYEFMYRAENHSFWNYIPDLSLKNNCHFVVPLDGAAEDIYEFKKEAKVDVIGHLSIDDAFSTANVKDIKIHVTAIKKQLSVKEEENLIVASGCTQPLETDKKFLTVLLQELAKLKNPNLQLRFSIHPGTPDKVDYLQQLLAVSASYPETSSQFQFIINKELSEKLKNISLDEKFLLRAEVTGNDATMAANAVTQAVPGALLNTAALQGGAKPFYNSGEKSYLVKDWFAESAFALFSLNNQAAHTRQELKLSDATAPQELARVIKGLN
jgi:hypothetical protein